MNGVLEVSLGFAPFVVLDGTLGEVHLVVLDLDYVADAFKLPGDVTYVLMVPF